VSEARIRTCDTRLMLNVIYENI